MPNPTRNSRTMASELKPYSGDRWNGVGPWGSSSPSPPPYALAAEMGPKSCWGQGQAQIQLGARRSVLSGALLGLLHLPHLLLLQPFLYRELPLVSSSQGQDKFQGLSSLEPATDCSSQGQSQN